jgi:hypothetical protein
VLLRDIVYLRNICISTLHKGDSDDDNDNNNNSTILTQYMHLVTLYVYFVNVIVEKKTLQRADGAISLQTYHFHVPTVLKSGSLNLLEPSGPVQNCTGIALTFMSLQTIGGERQTGA